MAALCQKTKGSSFPSRFKAFLAFQKFNHSSSKVRSRKQQPAVMDSVSEVETGEIDYSKWRKLDSRNFGIGSSNIPPSPSIVLKVLQSEGFEAYLVGGCVRDLILNRIPKDYDIITTASLPQIRRHFHHAQIVGQRFPICKVHVKGSVVEVSSFDTVPKQQGKRNELLVPKMPKGFHGRDFILWKNSMHRDFTVNSLFFNPSEDIIYDYSNAMVDLESLQLRTLVPAYLSFEDDCALILRGLRLAARLKLSFTKEIEDAIHKFSSSLAKLNKSRLRMEVNYMLSYGAAEPSLSLLQRYNILEILLPFHAAHLAQHSRKQMGESSAMLMKLFSSLDQLVTCGRPSHDNLWISLLAFHLALITKPTQALVVLTFASVLYHGHWEDGVKFAKRNLEAAVIYAPEIIASQGYIIISGDELAQRVKKLAVHVKNSLNILTDKRSLMEAMSMFPGSPFSGVVLVSKKIGKVVKEIFDILLKDVTLLKTRRSCSEIDYPLLGKGEMRDTRFVLGKVILDTIVPGVIPGGEVSKEEKHTLVKGPQPRVDATEENIGGNEELKRRNFVCEGDNQPKASAEIKCDRAEKRKLFQKGSYALEEGATKKRKSVSAKLTEGKAVEKQDLIEYKDSLSQKLDNGDAVTKKKSKGILENEKKKAKGEHDQLPGDEKRIVLEGVTPRQEKEQTGGNKDQHVNNGAITMTHSSKERRDSSQERNEERKDSLDSRKQNLQGGNLASDEKSKPKAVKRALSSIFR